MQPLILTLNLEDAAQAGFDRLRSAHFPPARNHLAAHLTLFHALPGAAERDICARVVEAARRPPFSLRVTRLRFLGHGVAYELESAELTALRGALAQEWQGWLTPQDRQPHRPHVTVQNKVAPEQARALLADLGAGFVPYDVTATGLALWRYLGGPWELVAREPFLGAQRVDRA